MQGTIENMLFSEASAMLALVTCGFLGFLFARWVSCLCAAFAQRKVSSCGTKCDWADEPHERTDAPFPGKSSKLPTTAARRRPRRQEKSVKVCVPMLPASSCEDQSNDLTEPVLSSADVCCTTEREDSDVLLASCDVLTESGVTEHDINFVEPADPETPCGQHCNEEASPKPDNNNRTLTMSQKKAERKARKAQREQELQKEQGLQQQEDASQKTEIAEPILLCADNLPTTECIKPAEFAEFVSDGEGKNEESKKIEYGYETDETYGDGGDWEALEELSNPSGDCDSSYGAPTQAPEQVVYIDSQIGFTDGQQVYEPVQTLDGQQLYTDGVTLFAAVCMPVPQPPSPVSVSHAMSSSLSLLQATSLVSGASMSLSTPPVQATESYFNRKPPQSRLAKKDDWDICWDFLPKKRWA